MAEKLVLLDVYSLANRAFFALPPLGTAAGQPTNAVYGLTMMLLRLLEDSQPDYLVAAFDTAAPTFRHQAFQAYKGQRLPAEDSFKTQIPIVRELLSTLGIPILERPGYEADDLIGSLSKEAAAQEMDVEIITGDRDAFQLVEPKITVLYTRKGITEMDRVDRAYLEERYHLRPDQLIDFKGLTGDSSDNIPGVPGFGEKTASKYLQQFGSLEEIYRNLDAIERNRDRELLEKYKDQALMSKNLVTIVTELKLLSDLKLSHREKNWERAALVDFCRKYEFNSLVNKLSGTEIKPEIQTLTEITTDYQILSQEDLAGISAAIASSKLCFVQFLSAPSNWVKSRWLGLALGTADKTGYYPLGQDQKLPPEIQAILKDEAIIKYGHDLKKQMTVAGVQGMAIAGPLEDSLIAAYLINGGVGGLGLEELTVTYLQKDLPSWTNERGTKFSIWELPENLPSEVLGKIATSRVAALRLIRPILENLLYETKLIELYSDVELPLIKVLFKMEQAGITIDPATLRTFGQELFKRQQELETAIYSLAGEQFNISSPKQLGVILFEKLGLKAPKKTKTGYSTDADTLESLAEEHPIISQILEYRQNIKLQTTYIDSLISLINPGTGRVHTTYNQAVTTTGRLSSTEPNLQNIPIRTEEGRLIRRAFLAKDQDHVLLAADYSQIELRVMAHFSQDAAFKDAFLKGEDIHRFTAAAVYGLTPEEVTREMRDRAKAVNFGIIYGISAFGLARNLKISRKEAEMFIDAYFQKYPGVKSYVEQLITQAQSCGEARTILGRVRKLPDLHSRNYTLRSFAERMARNTPIQGTAADIIKLAMVKIAAELRKRPELGVLLLQVHDELLFETPRERWRELARFAKKEMEGAIALSVPLVVDLKLGPNWGEMSPVTMEAE